MSQRSGWTPRTAYVQFVRWTMLTGSRRVLAGGVTLGFFLLTWGFVSYGVISVGPRTPITSILGSGVVAGLFSLIPVTLAINQLISSRIFGGLSQMENRLEGGRELRDTISDIAGESPPVRTAALLSFIGETLEEQAHTLSNVHRSGDAEIDEALDSYVTDINDYAEHLQQVSNDARPSTNQPPSGIDIRRLRACPAPRRDLTDGRAAVELVRFSATRSSSRAPPLPLQNPRAARTARNQRSERRSRQSGTCRPAG